MGAAFATIDDLLAISGVPYGDAQLERAEALLPLVSDLIRSEGARAGVDVDAKVIGDEAYSGVVKLVTCDVIIRVMRQSTTGAPMTQVSQSALGYTWSGTYAIPSGGVAMSLMTNERKMLGFRRQTYGVIETWEANCTESP